MQFSINAKTIVNDFVDALFFNSGRTSRQQYIIQFLLFSFFFRIILLAFALSSIPYRALVFLLMIVCYSFVIINVKRLNDLNKGFPLAFLALIPFISFFIFVYLVFAKGTSGSNNYGDSPFKKENFIENRSNLIVCTSLFGILALISAALTPAEESSTMEDFSYVYEKHQDKKREMPGAEAIRQMQQIESIESHDDDSGPAFSVIE